MACVKCTITNIQERFTELTHTHHGSPILKLRLPRIDQSCHTRIITWSNSDFNLQSLSERE
ncbi:lactate utilization protein C [Sesbania bispinosa]|nr:lactate utilization protein C [Sesbania bispinosa]